MDRGLHRHVGTRAHTPMSTHRGPCTPQSFSPCPWDPLAHRDPPHIEPLNTWDPTCTPSPIHAHHTGTPHSPHTGDPTCTQDLSRTDPTHKQGTPHSLISALRPNLQAQGPSPTEPCMHIGPYTNTKSPSHTGHPANTSPTHTGDPTHTELHIQTRSLHAHGSPQLLLGDSVPPGSRQTSQIRAQNPSSPSATSLGPSAPPFPCHSA